MPRVADSLWALIDLVFPSPQPRTREDIMAEENSRATQTLGHERIVAGLSGKSDQLLSHLVSCKDLLTTEDQRRQGVETRLTTIIGLSSIAGTIVLGTMIAPRAPQGPLGRLLALGLFYLVLQVCSAILAAVQGLSRRGYLIRLASDILPLANEAPAVHLRRQIRDSLAVLDDDRTLNNRKVTMMAVAHRAMMNFLVGLLVLAVLGTVHALSMKPTDDLVERLRQDHALQDLLRGPVGSPGPQGPPGTPCTTTPPARTSTAPAKP
jgi:hypothetical protein